MALVSVGCVKKPSRVSCLLRVSTDWLVSGAAAVPAAPVAVAPAVPAPVPAVPTPVPAVAAPVPAVAPPVPAVPVLPDEQLGPSRTAPASATSRHGPIKRRSMEPYFTSKGGATRVLRRVRRGEQLQQRGEEGVGRRMIGGDVKRRRGGCWQAHRPDARQRSP